MSRFGYWNKILHVERGDHTTWIEEPGEEFYRRYGGGRGMGRPTSYGGASRSSGRSYSGGRF